MLSLTLTKATKYLLVLINASKEDKVDGDKNNTVNLSKSNFVISAK